MTEKSVIYSYDRSADSSWIGEIPSHWGMIRIKHIASVNSSKVSIKPSDLPYIGLENIESQTGRLLMEMQPDTVESTVTLFQPGEVLFGKLRPYLAKVVCVNFPGACTTELLALQPSTYIETKFLFYLLISRGFLETVNSFTYGTKMPRVNWEQIGNQLIPLPPKNEQCAVVNFLDQKIAHIDSLIAKYQRLIELLQEKRISVISQAVTRGLNPDVPLKDSGVDWLGKIPENWKLLKIKHIAYLKSGEGITSDDIDKIGEYPVYGGNGLRGFTNSYTHEGDFVLIGRQGALCGNINYAQGKFWASEHAIVIYPKDNLSILWLGELLRAANLNQYSISAAQPGISVERINQLTIPYPPIDEQTAISEFLGQITSHYDAIYCKTQMIIDKLNEYRTTLISSLITGKIDLS